MPVLTRHDDFPNCLLISGDDLITEVVDDAGESYDEPVGSWRDRVKDLLFSDSNGVRNFAGEVDFIICYVNRGRASSHAGVDHAIEPRPVRGVIRLPGGNLAPGVVGNLSGGIAHEVGHYWLVPGGGRILTSAGAVDTPTPDEIAESLNRGLGLPPYPLMGRQDSHWSPFANAQNSAMDGINHTTILPSLSAWDGYTRTLGTPNSGVSFYVEGESEPFTTASRYSDFELYLMGILAPPTFDPSAAHLELNRARWVYPLWFDCGMFVECEDSECWYLGFHRGPHLVAARSLGGVSVMAPLRAPFDPRDLVGVRAVQRGDQLVFQARFFPAPAHAQGCAYELLRRLGADFVWNARARTSLSAADLLGDVPASVAPPDAGDAQQGWTTLATYTGRATKIGIGARHIDGKACFARLKADVFIGAGELIAPLDLAEFTRVHAIDQEEPLFVRTTLQDGSFVLPYRIAPDDHVVLEHTQDVDLAPRLVTELPPWLKSDFAFGAQIQLVESSIVTWAGGNGRDRTFIGQRQRIRFDEFDFTAAWGDTTDVRRAAPPDNTYRFLFCFVSRAPLAEEELVPKLQGLDLTRRAWESCFRELTLSQRSADTSIP